MILVTSETARASVPGNYDCSNFTCLLITRCKKKKYANENICIYCYIYIYIAICVCVCVCMQR